MSGSGRPADPNVCEPTPEESIEDDAAQLAVLMEHVDATTAFQIVQKLKARKSFTASDAAATPSNSSNSPTDGGFVLELPERRQRNPYDPAAAITPTSNSPTGSGFSLDPDRQRIRSDSVCSEGVRAAPMTAGGTRLRIDSPTDSMSSNGASAVPRIASPMAFSEAIALSSPSGLVDLQLPRSSSPCGPGARLRPEVSDEPHSPNGSLSPAKNRRRTADALPGSQWSASMSPDGSLSPGKRRPHLTDPLPDGSSQWGASSPARTRMMSAPVKPPALVGDPGVQSPSPSAAQAGKGFKFRLESVAEDSEATTTTPEKAQDSPMNPMDRFMSPPTIVPDERSSPSSSPSSSVPLEGRPAPLLPAPDELPAADSAPGTSQRLRNDFRSVKTRYQNSLPGSLALGYVPVEEALGAPDFAQPERETFSGQLALVTTQAPERTAERMLESLKQECLKETAFGNTKCAYDLNFNGERAFIDQVARLFVSKVEAQRFRRVEWWNGREWREQSKRYHLHKDPDNNRFFARIQVEWISGMPIDSGAGDFTLRRRRITSFTADVMTPLQQLHEMLLEQQQLLKEFQASQSDAIRAAEACAVASYEQLRSHQDELRILGMEPTAEDKIALAAAECEPSSLYAFPCGPGAQLLGAEPDPVPSKLTEKWV